MIFNTYNRTPKIKTNAKLKALWIGGYSLLGGSFLFAIIVMCISAKSILPALIILPPLLLLATLMAISIIDMEKSHIVIDGDRIRVVDYRFCIKKEKTFSVNEIKHAKIALRGSRQSVPYIVFQNAQGRDLFKLMYYPENKDYFEKLLGIEITS